MLIASAGPKAYLQRHGNGPKPNDRLPRITAWARNHSMKSYQLFAAISPALTTEILEFDCANDKKLYRAALDAVAQVRKVRTVFLERQPRTERHATVALALTRPSLELAADSLLRSWLLKKYSSLLTDFLDALKIPHEKGAVENLPQSIEDAALQSAVADLLAKHPP